MSTNKEIYPILEETSEEKFWLEFVEEGILDLKYVDWVGGRVEIHTANEQYALDELRFFAPRNAEWNDFRERYDTKSVDKTELKKIFKLLTKNFILSRKADSDFSQKSSKRRFFGIIKLYILMGYCKTIYSLV